MEGKIYDTPLLIDLKKEWKSLSIYDMKLLLQKELYGNEWHHVEAANISESLEHFNLSRDQSKDHNKYFDLENNKATGVTKDLHSTLKKEESIRDWHEMRSSWFSKKIKIWKEWM